MVLDSYDAALGQNSEHEVFVQDACLRFLGSSTVNPFSRLHADGYGRQ